MGKVQNICAFIIFTAGLSHCSENNKKIKQDPVNSKTKIETKNSDDNSINHGLTLDLDYEKYPREKLKPIIETFLKINSIKNWTDIQEIDLKDSAEGGIATFYFNDGELKKVISKYYGEKGKSIKEYYLDKNKIIFAYETEYNYNRPISFDSTKMKEFKDTAVFDITKSDILEDRSYFQNGILIHQSNNQDCGSPFAESYLKEEQKRIMNECQRLTKLVRQKQST